MASMSHSTSPRNLYIAGSIGGSSIGPPAHNFIAESLGKAWKMQFLKKTTAQAVMDVFRRPDFAGGAVTMPHKKTIMPYLDKVDDLAISIGACNVVYLTPEGRLHGTNVDWAGIVDALLAASGPSLLRQGGPAMIYGAGGASRAAVYALSVKLGYRDIYIVNRDDGEVADLEEDVQAYKSSIRPNLTHVKSTNQAMKLPPPSCIVSTVPDFEPRSAEEIEAKNVLIEFLSRKGSKDSILLDMCYHPRTTRNIALAVKHGWAVVEGIKVVAHQIKLQWKFWASEEISDQCEKEAMALIQRSADADPSVTPERARF